MKRAIFVALVCASAIACKRDAAPVATVGSALPIRGVVRMGPEDDLVPLRTESRIEKDRTIDTGADGRTLLHLDGGATVLVDRGTRVVAGLASVRVVRGRVFVDATSASATTIETTHGTIVLDEAAASVRVGGEKTEAYCGVGEATYRSPRGSDRFAQGETLVLGTGRPDVSAAEVWEDWTGGLADPARRRLGEPSFVGVLEGRAVDVRGVASEPLSIRAHEVNVTVEGNLATTEVVQTFFNGASDPVVGEYRARLPVTGLISGFDVDMGTGFTSSAINAVAGDGYSVSWTNAPFESNRLVYDGPNRVLARIAPIQPGAVVRLRIRYTEWLERHGRVRTYVYPMRSEGEPPLVGELSLRVDTTESGAAALRAGMGAEIDGSSVRVHASDTRPRADFVLELFDEAAPDHASVFETRHAGENGGPEEVYALFDVPTDTLFEADASLSPLDLVILVDTSGGTRTEDLELARSVVQGVLDHLAPTDRVALRFADVDARLPDGLSRAPVAATAEVRRGLLEAISRENASGATDLAEALRQAANVVAGKPRGAVLYLGDGVPTTGALSATAVLATLSTVAAAPRMFALGIGDDANADLLRAIFGDETAIVRERTEATMHVLTVLAEAARDTVRDLRLDLGANVERVYPKGPLVAREGESVRVVGRVHGDLPERISAEGRRDGRTVRASYDVARETLDGVTDVRRRWGAARFHELLDEDAGREAISEVGQRFALLTPFTARVVAGTSGGTYRPLTGFDHDPFAPAWGLGGRGPTRERVDFGAPLGWRRALVTDQGDVDAVPESTWDVHDTSDLGTTTGDGGLALAAVSRTLAISTRGPMSCFERKLLVRPDLRGSVIVSVQVDGTGAVRSVTTSSNLGVSDVESCVAGEVRGLSFPATGGTTVITVSHTYVFEIPGRAIGMRRTCSAAASRDLGTRSRLFRERLGESTDVQTALAVYRQAESACELPDFRSRRTLLRQFLDALPTMHARVELYRAFAGDLLVSVYLKQEILRRVRTAEDVAIVRAGLGLDAPVTWTAFARLWNGATTPEAKLALVRRWLDVVPDDFDLRLRLLRLLEETNKLPEARRHARALCADPLADARVRARVAEFWLRQRDRDEARRVLSEIVERAPLDPWARRRLGDLYLAHGFDDDAYREYQTLARLRADDPSTLLLLARAASAAQRTDEALRLEQRLAEQSDGEVDEGVAAVARWSTAARLAEMKSTTRDAATRRLIEDRERSTGARRDPPAIWVALVWTHPEDRFALEFRTPALETTDPWERAVVQAADLGLEAFRIREREDGTYTVRVTRPDTEDLRPQRAKLVIVERPGERDERITIREVTLTREARTNELTL